MKVISGLVPVGRSAAPVSKSGWSGLLPETRARKGQHLGAGVIEGVSMPVAWADQRRILSFESLWRIYHVSADVRSVVNSIVRRLSTWDWDVEPTLDPADDGYEALDEVAESIEEFLAAPNTDGETWQVLWTKVLIDLLIFDAAAIEVVKDKMGRVRELVALRGCDIRPVVDELGRVIEYTQDVPASDSVSVTAEVRAERPTWKPDELIYIRLFGTTSSPEGLPILESLVNEVGTLLRSSDHLLKAVDVDEIPPGILVLGGIQGDALARAKEEFVQDRGKDHRIRIFSTPNPGGVAAEWIELRHTPKDLELLQVYDKVRRMVWRAFGVMPIEMGETDGAPRASTETQADLGESQLLEPILEIIASAVQRRVIPLLVEDPEMAKQIVFSFDLEAKATAGDESSLSIANSTYVKNGILTRNEVRERLGYSPVKSEAADILTVEQGGSPVPLDRIMEEPEPPVAPIVPGAPVAKAPAEGGDAADGGVATEDGDPEAEPNVDPETLAKKPLPAPQNGAPTSRRGLGGSQHERVPTWRSVRDLPSDWQPAGRFKGYRTLPLTKLGEQIVRYAIDVEALWKRTREDVLGKIASTLADRTITPEEGAKLIDDVSTALRSMSEEWQVLTAPRYRDVAKLSRDRAAEYTQRDVLPDYMKRAEQYEVQAMGWLRASDGPIEKIRSKLVELIAVASMDGTVRSDMVDVLGLMGAALVSRVASLFDAQEYRIDNWSGKLVDFAYSVFSDALVEGGAPVQASEPASEQTTLSAEEWWCEWVSPLDSETCATCMREGNLGFRPLSSLTVKPGAGTECRARCRCVLTCWTATEVRNGTAVSLKP